MLLSNAAVATIISLSIILPQSAGAGELDESVARFRAVRDSRSRTGSLQTNESYRKNLGRRGETPSPLASKKQAMSSISKDAMSNDPASIASVPTHITIDEAVKIVLESHYGLRIKEHAVALALIGVSDVTRQMLPLLNFAFTGTELNEARSMVFGGNRLNLSSDFQKNYGLALSWPLYLFGKLDNAERAARAGVDSARADRASDAVNAAFQVKQAFYGMLLAQRFVKIAEQSLEQIDNHVKTVKSQFEVGMASKFDLLRVEVQRANTKPQLIRANLALTNAKESFNMLLGRPVGTPVEPKGELAGKIEKPADADARLARALERRQDLLKSRKDLEAARFALAESLRGKRPTLALASNYSRTEGAGAPLDKWDESWNASLALQLPIFDARATATNIDKGKERVKQAEIAAEMAENQVRLDVRTAMNEMIQAVELVTASEKNIVQAEEALNIANVSYENGLNTNLEVMDAQLALDHARTNHSQAVHDWLVAKAKLDRACGDAPEIR